MRTVRCVGLVAVAVVLAAGAGRAQEGKNLLADPSFEKPKPKDRWGNVFTDWGGWIYEGPCEFRVSDVARTGKHSLLIVGGTGAKVRARPNGLKLEPGRYRVTAYLRGLDIGTGVWNQTTEFMFTDKYMPLKKNGTFGWTPLTYVGEVDKAGEAGFPSFGLMAPGYLWVDDVTLEKVGPDAALTPEPVLGKEEAPIQPPGPLPEDAVRCPECGYRNSAAWGKCYACGTGLGEKKAVAAGPPVKLITSFEKDNPFGGGTVVAEHATDGKKALRIDKGFVALDGPQSWLGYDFLKADVFTAAKKPVQVYVEVRDRLTTDYWTRVNYTTVVPPGASTLIVPTALYVGEKSRPGRALVQDGINRLVFSVGDRPEAPLYVDNVRLERDTATARAGFEGLWAFDVGPAGSPLMEGFTPLDAGKTYSKGRGYGWKDVRVWRAFDALQPDPLYQDFLCVEKGGLALDVPNGRYFVFVNMDSPSGFWGEVQLYRQRALIVEGKRYEDTMDLARFRQWYFRSYDKEDLPGDTTFDKYQVPYFREKQAVAEVKDGQLNIDFEGDNWACCVSAIVVYPEAKAAQGQKFLQFVKERRRFHFDNAFKRVLPELTGEPVTPTAEEKARGYVVFHRDPMKDVSCLDRPLPGERDPWLAVSAFAGEYAPVTLSVLPFQDLGKVTARVSDLAGPGGMLPASAVDVGHVRHRIARVTAEGSVYTIEPRSIIPGASAPVPAGVTRTFWLTVKAPAGTKPGVYRGEVRLTAERGGEAAVPVEVRVRRGSLDPVDVPVGPWSYTIDLPWYGEEAAAVNRQMAAKSLAKLKEYGFTTATGLPVVTLRGFKDGKPDLDFRQGDEQMRLFKDMGFTMPMVTYCHFGGLNLYYRDEAAMKAAGFTNYSDFLKVVFGAVQKHADEAGWLPVYWNLADEPIGDDLVRSAENAEAYRKAFPKGPPWFTGASSFTGSNAGDPHFRLSRALHVANWNLHDEAAVRLQHAAGSGWAFYNGGNRWTYGVYLYKAAREHGMKFRVSWHWNACAGDPYYALDCREDDYAWCTASPTGELIPTVFFERLREGLGDYRRVATLARLVREKPGTDAAARGDKLLKEVLGSFRLGERELKGVASFDELRDRLDGALEAFAEAPGR